MEKQLQAMIQSSNSRSSRFGDPGELLAGMNRAWVLIFNPMQPNEGVYTLSTSNPEKYPEDSNNQFMLAFEDIEEASRFAQQLAAEDLSQPSPMHWLTQDLTDFCYTAGFALAFVPSGALFLPPSSNSYDDEAFKRLADEARAHEKETEARGSAHRSMLARAWLERIFRDEE